MPTGEVKFWREQNGWGMLKQADGPDVFIHVRAVQRAGYGALAPKQRVQFRIEPNPRNGRDHAVDLVLLEPIISPLATPSAFGAGP